MHHTRNAKGIYYYAGPNKLARQCKFSLKRKIREQQPQRLEDMNRQQVIDMGDYFQQNVMETQSVLKGSAKYIKYFANKFIQKNYKCVLAIIVLIVLLVLGLGDGKFNTSDQFKGSLTTDSSSSSTSNTITTTGS